MPTVSRDGVSLYYETYGRGVPLILSHGFSANTEMWRGQVDALAKDFKVIIWDMRGHGQTDYPEEQAAYTEEHTVQDMAAILDETCGRGSKAIVGGLSLGGYMSMAFYKRFPERMIALLMIDASPGISDAAERETFNESIFGIADQLEETGVSLLEMMAGTPERKRALSHRNTKGIARSARGCLAQHSAGLYDVLPHIKVPTLIIVGADDERFLPPCELMAKTIPNAEHIVIPEAGHAVNMDQPAAFLTALMPFLARLKDAKSNL